MSRRTRAARRTLSSSLLGATALIAAARPAPAQVPSGPPAEPDDTASARRFLDAVQGVPREACTLIVYALDNRGWTPTAPGLMGIGPADRGIRATVTWATSGSRRAEIVPVLAAARDGDSTTREAAAQALASIRTAAAVSALRTVDGSGDAVVQRIVDRALERRHISL